MRPFIPTLLLMLCLTLMSASVLPSTVSPAYSDKNSTLDSSTEDETGITANNWFFYRSFIALYEQYFLPPIDSSYLYGTDAVIVIGSGIDYFLLNLLNNYNKSQRQPDTNGTLTEKEPEKKEKSSFKEGYSNPSSEQLEQYLVSQQGKQKLPKQLYSSDKRQGERTYLISEWFSDRYIDNSFLDRTNRSYIRLRGGYAYSFQNNDEYLYSITARLKIPRTREKLDLVIGDETRYSSDLSLQGTEAERDNSIALGLNNPLGLLKPVDTKLRLGFSGITNPYAKASFNYQALLAHWLIVPNQTFRYSAENRFEEWTNLNFSRKTAHQMIFSLLIQRSTASDVDGMDYFVQPTLDFSLGRYGNFTPYMGMYGRTQEQMEDEEGYTPKRGIYRYAVGLNWSKQATRKYIVYRIQPILSYDDKYEFRPEYYVKALLEFYFGLRD